jgi:hypothetical protein
MLIIMYKNSVYNSSEFNIERSHGKNNFLKSEKNHNFLCVGYKKVFENAALLLKNFLLQ